MKQIKYTIFSVMFLTTIVFSGCNSILDDENIDTKNLGEIEVGFTRSSNGVSISSTSTSGLLIFWKETLNDFFSRQVENLDSYSEMKYNTGELYPSNNTTVYATGFSPASMECSNDLQTLSLSDANSGKTDVCVASERISGNRISPFKTTMSFEHTLTKILFTVERDATMLGIRDVRNITATIPNSYLPIEWNWDAMDNKYELNYNKAANNNLIFTHPDIISGTNNDELGTAYLMLPTDNNGKLHNIRITADILQTNSSTIERSIDNTLDIQLYDEFNNEVSTIQPGEAYIVRILFQQNSFTLIGRQLDNWEQGGLIYVPVKP